jgi:hypothetical protein
MQWPINTSLFSFLGSLLPEPVLDRHTGQQQADVNGEPLYSMELMCFWEKGAEVLTVSFPGTPLVGLRQGMPVKVTNLFVSACSMESRHGLAFRAAKVEPLGMMGPRRGCGMSCVPGRHAVPRSCRRRAGTGGGRGVEPAALRWLRDAMDGDAGKYERRAIQLHAFVRIEAAPRRQPQHRGRSPRHS